MIGTTWQVIANTIGTENKVQVNTVLPKEGATVLVGPLDGRGEVRAPQLHVQVDGLDHFSKGQRSGRRILRRSTRSDQGVRVTTEKDFCDIHHATDEAYAAQLHYWTTPQKQCVDGSGDNCTAYDEWVSKWQQIKG